MHDDARSVLAEVIVHCRDRDQHLGGVDEVECHTGGDGASDPSMLGLDRYGHPIDSAASTATPASTRRPSAIATP